MTWISNNLGFDLAWVFAWGAAIGTLYFAFAWAVDLLPLGADRRASLTRLRPLVGATLALTFGLFSSHALFSRYESVLPVALLLVLVAFFVGCRGLVGDFFSGVALRAEQSCQVGDHVRIGETRGRVTELGPRTLTVETPEGDRAVVPYSEATRSHIVRTRAVDRGASRTFTIRADSDRPYADVCELITRTALLHHWGSVVRSPELTPAADGTLEVTVFALGEQHTADLEKAVRSALASSAARRRPSATG